MGYHSNEETTKKAVKDCQRFINDRERLGFLTLSLLGYIGFSKESAERVIQSARQADFSEIESCIGGLMLTKCPDCGPVEISPDSFNGGDPSGGYCPKCSAYLTDLATR